jgi:poly [ADP-ribose] polymerase
VFNVHGFGSVHSRVFTSSGCATNDGDLRRARREVGRMTASYGGSDLHSLLDPLLTLRSRRAQRRPVRAILLSDMQISERHAVCELLRRQRCGGNDALADENFFRLLPIGVGSSANKHAMQAVARAGGGRSELACSASPYKLQCAVSRQLERSLCPSIEQLRVRWHSRGGCTVRAPRNLPSLFRGDRAVVFAMTDYCNRAELEAIVCGRELSSSVYTPELQFSTGTLVHRLAARAAIRDVEEAVLDERDGAADIREKADSKAAMVALAIKFGLLSSWTSYVAVEERCEGDDGSKKTTPQPNDVLDGVQPDILPSQVWPWRYEVTTLYCYGPL